MSERFVFIPYMRGATSHEGQIGRIHWMIPYRRFGGIRRIIVRLTPPA